MDYNTSEFWHQFFWLHGYRSCISLNGSTYKITVLDPHKGTVILYSVTDVQRYINGY